MSNGTIIYIGGFELPDKNAAAHRVLGNGKVFRELGYNVVFIGISHSCDELTVRNHDGFECWFIPYPRTTVGWLNYLTDISVIKTVASNHKDVCAMVFYNYQAGALWRAMRYCRKHHKKCIADVTEWYVANHDSRVQRLVKNMDTAIRMKLLHKKTDGVIVICRFLHEYYRNCANVVEIPPLTDNREPKWQVGAEKDGRFTLVYAGSPSALKERIDRIIEAVDGCDMDCRLIVVGITKEGYEAAYQTRCTSSRVEFMGRLSNSETIRTLKRAHYSIIIRDNNLVVRAGFPTKLAESISAGVPVIVNPFSNIQDYLDDSNSVIVTDDNIKDAINRAAQKQRTPDTGLFDYRSWIKEMKEFMIRVMEPEE